MNWIKSAADEHAARNGCYFDERAAVKVVEFFRKFLRHSSGEWAGEPFELLDWQRDDIVYPLFGWKRADGTRRYRIAYVELPKKNGKSTLASGLGLNLLLNDNEPGAEVYSAATTREQASIVHREAINMVGASPALRACLSINRSTKTIAHGKSNSRYQALSAEPRSSEGIKAHGVIADELHAWFGRQFWDSLRYAFRTRRQPLLFIITTAGDDIQSVCYEQHEYADRIIRGIHFDDRYFAYIRAADPSDDWTTIETARKANPSLGLTIKEDEFLADIEEAKRTPTSQARFKRYSLNIWQTSQSPWLKLEDWLACRQDFAEQQLEGQDCWGGLDLAKTRDLTAFVLCFPGDKYRFLPFFWLPEDAVNDPDNPEQYRIWAEQGWLRKTPGNVCDYSFIKRDLTDLAQRFQIRSYAFDPYNAEHLTQELEEECGLPRFAFPQTISNFAGPTAEFERLVVGRGLEHSGHPTLTWNIGNVSVRVDANNNKRPVKPPVGDRRKIDGVVAAIMALGQALSDPIQAYSGVPGFIL